ncbi:7108_t:CDS:2, partial [Funneliformis geosporum]
MCENELSETQHERIISAYLSGTKQMIILTQLGIFISTVKDTIKRYKETGFAIPEKHPGHPKILNQRDKQTLQRIVQNNHFASLSDITSRLNSSLDTTLHNNTVRNTFMMKALVVMSLICFFESDERIRTWRSPGEAYNKNCILPTVKFSGGSVMFWDYF